MYKNRTVLALGVDLAWGTGARIAETGVAAVAPDGRIVDAGWTRGIAQTVEWLSSFGDENRLAFIDAPLVVANESGQRACETQVGQQYWRWKVACNSTNLRTGHLAGVALFQELTNLGWMYSDGLAGPPDASGHFFTECYPYTALVGAVELGYSVERPVYKRKPKNLRAAEFRIVRAKNCDQLIARVANLAIADPPMLLDSNPVTRALLSEPSPKGDREYKHREDLIDALLCAWTAGLWLAHGSARCQVLGPRGETDAPRATIVAPARAEQRRSI